MRRSPFFDGVSQSDITVAGQAAKMPIFYYDGLGITAIFPARLSALRRLVPDPDVRPARFVPGVGMVAISAFEYRDTDVGEYNEVAISVILSDPRVLGNAPGQAVARALRRKQFHAYVHHLPVTTEAAREAGCDFYNFPKFIASIEFEHEADRISCRLAEGEEHILTLHSTRLTGGGDEGVQVFSHQWMDRRPQSTEVKLHATPLAATTRPGTARVELGARHPIALELGDLLVSRRSLHHQQMERFEGILYGPDRFSMPLLERMQRAMTPATAAR